MLIYIYIRCVFFLKYMQSWWAWYLIKQTKTVQYSFKLLTICLTCAGKTSHNEHIFKKLLFLIQIDVWFVGIGGKITELHLFNVDEVSKVNLDKNWFRFFWFQSKIPQQHNSFPHFFS